MKSKRRLAISVISVAVMAFGVLVGAVLPSGAGPQQVANDVVLESPAVTLQRFSQAAPFEAKQPSFLPKDSWLYRVSWRGGEAEEAQAAPEQLPNGARVYSINLLYKLADGTLLHIWQTNNPRLALEGKDPASEATGTAVNIEGKTWRRVQVREGVELGRRFDDGITVTVYGGIQESVLRKVASSIA